MHLCVQSSLKITFNGPLLSICVCAHTCVRVCVCVCARACFVMKVSLTCPLCSCECLVRKGNAFVNVIGGERGCICVCAL